MRVTVRRIVVAIVLVAIGWAAYEIAYASDRRVLRNNLRLSKLPASVKHVECDSPITTDIITDCYFTIDSIDFAGLLAGYTFRAYRPGVARGSVTFSDAGTRFPVQHIFDADIKNDPEFPHGGNVLIYVNADRTRVRTHYYAE